MRRRSLVDAVVVLGLFTLCLWQWWPEIGSARFHRDEARWIQRAEYVRELADPLGGYWDESTWQDRGGTLDERRRLRAQPPLGSYLMGIGLLLQGRDLTVNGFWNMDADRAWNEAVGNVPAEADLLAARRTTAMAGALTVIVVYLIGARLTNRAGGVAGALFLAMHPLLALLAVFAGSDALLAFVVALAALAAARFADSPTWPRALLLGALLGLGGATKLSPLLVAVPIGVLGLLVLALAGRRWGRSPWARWATHSDRAYGLRLMSVPVVAGVVFVGSYPYLWSAPVENSRAMFSYRATGMELQGALWSQAAVETRVEAIERVIRRLGEEFTVLGKAELAVAALGIVVWAVIALRQGLLGAGTLTFAVLGGQAVVTLARLRVDWSRYHLPILLFLAVALGVALGWAWSQATSLLATWRNKR